MKQQRECLMRTNIDLPTVIGTRLGNKGQKE